jgi:hypothetical protein
VDGHCYAGWRGCGFGVTAFQLVNQSKDLQRIEQNFRKLSDLRKALRMPLEGIWDYHVEYTKYFGKDKPHRKISEGIAVFLWTDGPPTGYNFFVGGGIQEYGREGPHIVTHVIKYFLKTDSLGNPTAGCSAHGTYKAITSSNQDFSISGEPDIELFDGKFDTTDTNFIERIRFKFQPAWMDPLQQTIADVTFTRIAPRS